MNRGRVSCFALAMALCGGCASYSSAARQRFEAQYACNNAQMQELNDTSFRFSGCGVTAIYTCATTYSMPNAMGARSMCVEEQSHSTRPAPVASSAPGPANYNWPPQHSEPTERLDEFAGVTVLSVLMTVGDPGRRQVGVLRTPGPYIIRIGARPGSRSDALSMAVIAPAGGAQYPQCNDLALIVGNQLVRAGGGEHSTGPNGEAITSFVLPADRLDPGLANGVLKGKFCGVQWTFTPPQIATLQDFRTRFQELALIELRAPSTASPAPRPPATPGPRPPSAPTSSPPSGALTEGAP